MDKKYFNDNIIGNSSILVSIDKLGNVTRFFAPNIDYMQHIEMHKIAIVLDNKVCWIDDESIFTCKQSYIENTNILVSEISSKDILLKQIDYVDISNDVLVRKYELTKKNEKIQNVQLLIYSDMKRNIDRFVCGWYNEELDCLLQYAKDSYFVTFSKDKISKFRINYALEGAKKLEFNSEEYVGLSEDSVIVYDFNQDKENKDMYTQTIYMGFKESMYLVRNFLKTIRVIDEKLMYKDTMKYWQKILSKIKQYNFKNDQEREIFLRGIILILSYTNNSTGGIIAGCECDEEIEKCGRYAYCWPRDAKIITDALTTIGLSDISDFFYSKFGLATQSDNGMWEQRFYTDCNLAPCWGSQIDETASMCIGMIERYLDTKEDKYLKVFKEPLDKAIEYLLRNMDEKTYDLWETFYTRNIYSYASIYKAFEMYVNNIPDAKNVSLVNIKMNNIKNTIETYWRDNIQSFVKCEDKDILDASILGLVWPFGIYSPIDDKIEKTVKAIEKRLTSPVGGICRFEKDTYVDCNPWNICTLWLAMYYLKKYEVTNEEEDKNKAIEYIDWVTEHASPNGYLTEQISCKDGKPEWVNGLAWSHAMYIICMEELYGKE